MLLHSVSRPVLHPPLIREDRPRLHIPKSFSDLQDLNYLLKKYRDIYPFRIVVSYVVTYLLWVLPSHIPHPDPF